MKARLLELELDAPSLRGNPLGDPSVRTVHALLPPGREDGRGLPAVLMLLAAAALRWASWRTSPATWARKAGSRSSANPGWARARAPPTCCR